MFGGLEPTYIEPPFNHPPLEIIGFSMPIHNPLEEEKEGPLSNIELPVVVVDAPLIDLDDTNGDMI